MMRADDLRVGDAGRIRAHAPGAGRRAGGASDRPGRSRESKCARRRPRWTICSPRSTRASTLRRARAGHDAHQAHGRRPDRLPARARRQGALPALRHRNGRARGDHPRPAPGRVRRARRHQPAARGARHSGGLAGRDPRRRQGRLPALRALADPDDRTRGAAYQRHGDPVCRHDHRLDAPRDRRDRAAPRDKQVAYNAAHGITPKGVSKRIKDIIDGVYDQEGARARS